MRQYVLHALASGPKILGRLLRVFPPDRLDDRIEEVGLTARGVVAHLASLEKSHLDRMRYAVSHPGTRLESVDPWERADDAIYNDKDPFHEAEVLASRRGMTLDYLSELTESDLNQKVTTPEGDTISLLDYAMSLIVDDMEHLEAVSKFLANEAATSL